MLATIYMARFSEGVFTQNLAALFTAAVLLAVTSAGFFALAKTK